MYSLSDFDFNLPQERIAQFPLPDRSASRLLHLDGAQIIDRQFADIVGLLQAGDLLVMNDTRVLKARFFGTKESGGKVEALVERVLAAARMVCHCLLIETPREGLILVDTGLGTGDLANKQRLGAAFLAVTRPRNLRILTTTFRPMSEGSAG